MKDRRGEVWMYEDGDGGWVVAVIVDSPRYDVHEECALHDCIQLAGDDEKWPTVGRMVWHEYDLHAKPWEKHVRFTRLA